MDLSVIIPAYNEEARLPKTLRHIANYFSSEAPDYINAHEIIIVDDGSTDRTSDVARRFAHRLPIKVVQLHNNAGKGAAVRNGVQVATGEYVLISDADGATPFSEIEKLYTSCIASGSDIVIGSRILGRVQKAPLHRLIVSRIYRSLCAGLVPGVVDTACGFKLFALDVAKHLFSLQMINRFAFDVEVISLACSNGYRIIEVPVAWKSIPGSKVNLAKDGFQMFLCILALYFKRWYRGIKGNMKGVQKKLSFCKVSQEV